jgi:alanine racemase
MSERDFDLPGILEHRPTQAVIDRSALRHNYHSIKRLVSGAKVLGSIKANAYGHGLCEVARILEEEGIDSLGVAFIEEAIQLRRSGVKVPILVFGGLPGDELPLFLEFNVEITASSVSKLEQVESAAKARGVRARVHIKIDTGLERIGTHYYSCQELLEKAARVEHCDVVGIYSHFAAIEPNDVSLGTLQLERFNSVVDFYSTLKPRPFLRHISASTGILGLPSAHLDMVRPGLILYGVYPDVGFSPQAQLRPALALKSQIVFFKVVKKGAGVSYSHTWHAPYDTRIVTVPIGYGDGYLRALSNKGVVLIRGKRAPVVGNVCMDQLMADIGPAGVGYNGDEVVLIGSQGDDAVSVEELATRVGTAPHEILTLLNQRIPRRYVD